MSKFNDGNIKVRQVMRPDAQSNDWAKWDRACPPTNSIDEICYTINDRRSRFALYRYNTMNIYGIGGWVKSTFDIAVLQNSRITFAYPDFFFFKRNRGSSMSTTLSGHRDKIVHCPPNFF